MSDGSFDTAAKQFLGAFQNDNGNVDATIKQLLGMFQNAQKSPGLCPKCGAEVLPDDGKFTSCPGCTVQLVNTPGITFEHFSVVAQYGADKSFEYWITRAAAEGLNPERLAAEIKYTTREYTYGSSLQIVKGAVSKRWKASGRRFTTR